MDGARCLDDNVIYQADVTAVGKRKEGYVGMAAPSFKSRLANHRTDFKYTGKRKHTRLAGYVWQLKDEGLDYEIQWQFLARAPTYKPSSIMVHQS